MSVLITAFEPFGDWERNTTRDVGEAVAALSGAELLVLPVDLEEAPRLLHAAIDERKDRMTVLLALGLHSRGAAIRVERSAENIADFRIPDNAGRRPRKQRLVPEAPTRLVTAVDVDAVVAAMRGTGAEVEPSTNAGTYLCNAVYFHLLYRLRRWGVSTVFLHLPPAPGDAARALARRAEQLAGDPVALALSAQERAIDPLAAMELPTQIAAVMAALVLLRGQPGAA